MDESYYINNGIGLVTQDWTCREYDQQFTDKTGFVSNLSIIDLLLNVNREKALEIITN